MAGKGIHEERMGAWMALLQTHATVVGALEEALLAEQNLPLSWFEVLIQLTAQPDGRLPMQELARSVLLSKSGVTRLVDRMADAGLVLRESCASDRRVVYATATARGRALLTDAMPVFVEGFERSFSRHYARATGVTPLRAIERLRVEGARHLLSETHLPIKRISQRCGFGSEETMRRSFMRLLATTPQDYRARFAR